MTLTIQTIKIHYVTPLINSETTTNSHFNLQNKEALLQELVLMPE